MAAAVVLPTLGRQALSWNEAVTADAAQRSPGQLWILLRHTDAPLGLYYLLMHGWLVLLRTIGIGPTAFWLRLPSALAMIAGVGLVVVLTRRFFGVRAAVISGAVLAVHPMMTFYAQDARPYALVVLAFLATTAALIRGLQAPSPWRVAVFAALAVSTIYLHLFAVYAFAAHAYLISRYGAPYRRRWLAAGVFIAGAVAPLAVLSLTEHAEVGWIPRPSARVIASVVLNVYGGVGFAIAVLIVAAVAVWRRGKAPVSPPVVFLMMIAALPVLALIALDFVSRDLVARYALVSVPAVVVLLALAVTRLPRAMLTSVTALALVVAVATTAVQQARPFKYEDYRHAAEAMGDLAVPGAAVMFLPISSRAGFQPYQALEPDLRRVADPAVAPGSLTSGDRIGGADRAPGALTGAFAGAPMIFVLGDNVPTAVRTLRGAADQAQLAALRAYRVVRTIRSGDLYLTVYQRNSAA